MIITTQNTESIPQDLARIAYIIFKDYLYFSMLSNIVANKTHANLTKISI